MLKKWQTDLLGAEFTVYTNHQTLKNFNTQHDLSWHQLHWQEFLFQYEMKIVYIKGEDNCITDALSWLPENCFKDWHPEQMAPHEHWKNTISAVLSITSDQKVLVSIKSGYNLDPYCVCLAKNNIPGTHLVNGLWSVGDPLVIPQIGDLQENLYHLVHDLLGHFRADKSYSSLHDNYYWPNMCTDLEKSYILTCDACQWNKSQTTKPPGPPHPLLILDKCGDSVTLDLIGPLPANKGYNCILSMTDRLSSNVWIIPT